MNKKNLKQVIFQLVLTGMLAALSVVALIFIRIPIIPAAPYLVYDMADIPILIAALLFGPVSGLAVLLVVCLIQAFTLGGDSWAGFIMHFVSSGAMVIIMGYFYRYKRSVTSLVIASIISIFVMTAIMIGMNLIVTPIYYGISVEAVVKTIVPVIIPFNLFKATVNSIATVIVFMGASPILSKYKLN